MAEEEVMGDEVSAQPKLIFLKPGGLKKAAPSRKSPSTPKVNDGPATDPKAPAPMPNVPGQKRLKNTGLLASAH